MLLGENPLHETHYDILSVREDASYEEIRASYRSAILHFHPDKLHNSHGTPSDDRFLKIQKAWEILGDANQRAVYDCSLRSSRQEDAVTADEIGIEDMAAENAGEGEVLELYHQCRCGDYFSVDSSELETMGFKLSRGDGWVRVRRPGDLAASVVLPCGSCSLKVRMRVDSDTSIPLGDDWS